ncbi:hypothetical protein [Akkermansia sp.]|uniref:hypothetical protein n=1 Tax=Akkermansia sp. TaxID=1872421 RepID=UPI0025C48EAE|nr:hypothetical protein [Akkermansia sp.]MCC8149087.1 hypothetical protein [Akkermansia sp.]
MSNPDDTSNVVAATAASIPDAVKDAFAAGNTLSLGDVLLLETAGCRFIAAGAAPTFREMSTVYWLLADKQAFRLALDSGDFDAQLQAYADKLSPSVIPAAASNIRGILARSFAPASGAGKPMPTPTA